MSCTYTEITGGLLVHCISNNFTVGVGINHY